LQDSSVSIAALLTISYRAQDILTTAAMNFHAHVISLVLAWLTHTIAAVGVQRHQHRKPHTGHRAESPGSKNPNHTSQNATGNTFWHSEMCADEAGDFVNWISDDEDLWDNFRGAGNLSNTKWFSSPPYTDSILQKRYKSCAVVSNSGVLANYAYGAEIDEADLVLRFNYAPVVGYETIVGTKDNVRIMNNVAAKEILKYLENPDKLDGFSVQPGTVYLFFMGPTEASAIEATTKLSHLYPNSPMHWGDHGMHDSINATLFDKIWGWNDAAKAAIMSGEKVSVTPTTGAVGMVLLMGLCQEVRAYGMADSPQIYAAPYHYYGLGKGWDTDADVHNNGCHGAFGDEKLLWKKMAVNGQADVDSTDVAVIPGWVEPTAFHY